MTRRRYLSTAALLGLIATPISAAQPETWTVTCHTGSGTIKNWTNTTPPNITNGMFQFTLMDGTEVRTTAGLNCYATKNPPKAS